ncbi:MAG TPA: 4-alpha-glucanotransferase, partial [Anaeromyxobacteraceae bacterium]|nr:4-alpha-glucanotransferase [Anaeromyxobacteraceae bacterium]
MAPLRPLLRDALEALGIRRFLLALHDAAFPARPEEDAGIGSPQLSGADEVLALASDLGFDGIQLGPAGATSASNPSPYDGALFSRSPLAIALPPLASADAGALLSPRTLASLIEGRPGPPDRVAYRHAYAAYGRALAEVAAAFRARRARGEGGAVADLDRRLRGFRARSAAWLDRDALFEALSRAHGGAGWRAWPAADRDLFAPAPGEEGRAAARRGALLAAHADEVEAWALGQLLAHEGHARFRGRARAAGLRVHGDLQAGLSERDVWASAAFVLPDLRMGAPPSRTDPGGQAWGFAVLDPGQRRGPAGEEGPALAFVRARAARAFQDCDGARLDHPHGLVCPWVYRVGGDPDAEVRRGARLLDSPDLPWLAPLAIARPEQLDRALPRHADGWVRALDDGQVERYAALLDAVVAAAPSPGDVACEVLSTLPYPLRRVLDRHGLGRFRVTQKADLSRPDDVYRGENARPEDWIMLGNHDTRPMRAVAARWLADGTALAHARRLAARL